MLSRPRVIRSFLWASLLWLLTLPCLAAGGDDDYCGAVDTKAELRCPRTTAATCTCYLGTRTMPGELPIGFLRRTCSVKVRRPPLPLLSELPRLEPLPPVSEFLPRVPTRPPRPFLS